MMDESVLIETASAGEEALRKLKNFDADIVVTDAVMPNMDGVALMEKIRLRHPGIFVVVATEHGSVQDAVKAIKAGAYDFLLKPSKEILR
jgi:DNA-binding NtrC family response regulator